MTDQPAPVFEAPWHAQVFALTVHLNETGLFAWADWAARFSATLKARCMHKDLNGGDDYFHAWLETLEAPLVDLDAADARSLAAFKQAWTEAYLSTPHGAPVKV